MKYIIYGTSPVHKDCYWRSNIGGSTNGLFIQQRVVTLKDNELYIGWENSYNTKYLIGLSHVFKQTLYLIILEIYLKNYCE